MKKYAGSELVMTPEQISMWETEREKLIYPAIYAKFNQNSDLKNWLLNTEDWIIVEANKYDKIWGIGMDINNDNIADDNMWGTNILGKSLMKVREELKSQDIETFGIERSLSCN
jgi:ribA/ribD-fused uncharacterized protein